MEIDEFLASLFDKAKTKTFDAYEAYYVEGDSFSVSVFQGEIDQYNVNNYRGLSFRVLTGKQMGYSYTESFDLDAIDLLIDSAQANAKLIESEDVQFIYDGAGKYEILKSFNEDTNKVNPEEKIDFAKAMEKYALNYSPKVRAVEHCALQTGQSKIRILNSKGLDKSFKSNAVMAVLVPVVEDNGRSYTGTAYRAVFDFNQLDAAEIAKEGVEDALMYIGAQSIPSGQYPVVIRNMVASDMLDTFCGIFNAENVQKGLSQLGGKLSQKIAADNMTILDDALYPGGLASIPFDSEGVPTSTKTVVESGVLKTYLHNLQTAHKDGVQSTGNASKSSFASPIGIAPYHFYIKEGQKTEHEIISSIKAGLYVTDIQGLHAGANSVSGDFSFAAKGRVIKNGQLGEPVEQITLGGNFYTLLQNISEIGKELYFGLPSSGGCFGSPPILVPNMTVAGK